MFFSKKKLKFKVEQDIGGIYKLVYNGIKVNSLNFNSFLDYSLVGKSEKISIILEVVNVNLALKEYSNNRVLKIIQYGGCFAFDIIYNNIFKKKNLTANIDLINPDELDAYCITSEGWLPLNLGVKDAIVLADRNFISKIYENYENNLFKKDSVSTWMNNLHSMNMRIDLLHYVLESNRSKFTNEELIKEQIQEARIKLKKAYPKLKIIDYQDIELHNYALKVLNKVRPLMKLRQEFLLEVAKYLIPTSKNEKIIERWNKVSDCAEKVDIDKKDISVILSLLAVVLPQKNSFPIGIIKPSDKYTEKNAYNAVFDMSLIEFLLNLSLKYKDQNYVVATCDKNLVQFGALLSTMRIESRVNDVINVKISLPKTLFPNEQLYCYFEGILQK